MRHIGLNFLISGIGLEDKPDLSYWMSNGCGIGSASLSILFPGTFRRYIDRYEDEGLDGLISKRLNEVSHRRAPVDEVMKLVDCYRSRHEGWNVKHFYAWYKREGGGRSYTWVKNRLQRAKLVPKVAKRGAHRKRRERSALPGMLVHRDGSTHEWVPGQH